MATVTFLPWIVYAALGGHSAASQQRGTLAALAVTVLVIAYKRRAGSPFEALIIETGSAIFFAAIAAVAFAAPHSGLLTYSAALSSTTLAVIAWASLAGHPFTLGMAKQTTPREVWSQPAFMHSNVVITAIWAVSLTVSAVILVVVIHAGADVLVRITFQVLGFVVPMAATARYVKIVHAQAHQAVGYARPGAHVRPLSRATDGKLMMGRFDVAAGAARDKSTPRLMATRCHRSGWPRPRRTSATSPRAEHHTCFWSHSAAGGQRGSRPAGADRAREGRGPPSA